MNIRNLIESALQLRSYMSVWVRDNGEFVVCDDVHSQWALDHSKWFGPECGGDLQDILNYSNDDYGEINTSEIYETCYRYGYLRFGCQDLRMPGPFYAEGRSSSDNDTLWDFLTTNRAAFFNYMNKGLTIDINRMASGERTTIAAVIAGKLHEEKLFEAKGFVSPEGKLITGGDHTDISRSLFGPDANVYTTMQHNYIRYWLFNGEVNVEFNWTPEAREQAATFIEDHYQDGDRIYVDIHNGPPYLGKFFDRVEDALAMIKGVKQQWSLKHMYAIGESILPIKPGSSHIPAGMNAHGVVAESFRSLIESSLSSLKVPGKYWIHASTEKTVDVGGSTHINLLPSLNPKYRTSMIQAFNDGWIRVWSKAYSINGLGGALMFEFGSNYRVQTYDIIIQICAATVQGRDDWKVYLEEYNPQDVLVKSLSFDLANFEDFFA